MELEFNFDRKNINKVSHISMWLEMLFPNATISEHTKADGFTKTIKLFDPTLSGETAEYYNDNIGIENLMETYPSHPSMKHTFYHMDSRVVWGSQFEEIQNVGATYATIELEKPNDEDDIGQLKGQRNNDVDALLENVCQQLNLKLQKIAHFRTIQTKSTDNVQLTSHDIKRMVASSLMNSAEPKIAIVNSYNVDGFRSSENRRELSQQYVYVSPSLEIVITISPKN